jgi:hypothetical protein
MAGNFECKEMQRSVVKEVEEEYGEPFWDVVRGYAADGHSINATALMLGYAASNPLYRLIQRHGVDIEFASAQESIFQKEARLARRGKCSEAQRKSCEKMSASNDAYIYIEYQGVRDTLAGHIRRTGISASTARKRYARNKDPDYVFSSRSHYVPPPKKQGWQDKENTFMASVFK